MQTLSTMLSGSIGIIHFVAAILALLTGTMVLASRKGTAKHRKLGYSYSVTMGIVLATSFLLYNLHGRFGILHWFAVVSSVTLLAGMIPMFLKRPKQYLKLHLAFMYWSVIGLYCAFFAEILTRIPHLFELDEDVFVVFYSMVGLATGLVGGIGSIYFRKYKKRWDMLAENWKKVT